MRKLREMAGMEIWDTPRWRDTMTQTWLTDAQALGRLKAERQRLLEIWRHKKDTPEDARALLWLQTYLRDLQVTA